MKKIIYSLVIMIAAGSLFTSCVENTEPQGIRDLREAKADYLASLSKLREADAELVKAKAAYKQAEIAIVEADAALKQALVEQQKLWNEATAKGNEQYAAEVEAKIAAIKAQAERAAVDHQKLLAEKQQALEQALRRIAAQAIGLTVDEQLAIQFKITALRDAQNAYHTAFVNVERAKMAIWEKEYDLAAGYDIDVQAQTVTAIADYNQLKEDAEEGIVLLEGLIAANEALLEDPYQLEETLEAYQDTVKQYRIDSLLAQQELDVYVATNFPDEVTAYNNKWAKFNTDTLAPLNPGAFSFSKTYNLVDGKNLDSQFKIFTEAYGVDTAIVKVDTTAAKVKIAGGNATSISAQIAKLQAIVDALNRDQVILDNIADSTTIAQAVAAAAEADSVYGAHRAILAAGLDSFAVYKAAKDTFKMYQDTVKDAKTADSLAKAKVVQDSANIKGALKTAAGQYKSAVAAFQQQLNNISRLINSGVTLAPSDTTSFVDAAKALGVAQRAFLGKEDSILTIYPSRTGEDTVVVYLSQLDRDGFVKKTNRDGDDYTLYDKGGYGPFFAAGIWHSGAWLNTAFDNIRETVTSAYSWMTFTPEMIAEDPLGTAPFDANSDYAYDLTGIDTIAWGKTNTGVAAYAELETDKVKATAAANALSSAQTKLANKQTKVSDAKDAYVKIYEKFWAKKVASSTDTANVIKAQKFPFSDLTFSEPTNCVVFKLDKDSIVAGNTLKVVLDGIYGTTHYSDTSANAKDVNACEIFYGDFNGTTNVRTKTEFANALFLAQKAASLGTYNSRKAQLENLNTQVAAATADLAAAAQDYSDKSAGYNAAVARLTGGTAQYPNLATAPVTADGKWNLKGYQKAWADECSPAYPGVKANAAKKAASCSAKIAYVQNYVQVLEDNFVALRNLTEDTNEPDLAAIINSLEGQNRFFNRIIDVLKEDIVLYTKAIAEIEAGYDVNSTILKVLNDQLEKAEQELEFAEEQLKIAQAEYDAVIAKYGIKDAE